MDDIKNESPSVPRKKNVTIRRSKSDIQPMQLNESPSPSFNRRPTTVREIFLKITNMKRSAKKENGAGAGAGVGAGPDANAIPIPGPSTESDTSKSRSSTNELDSPSEQNGFCLTEKDADEYCMKHPKRGKAIILNHENFDKESQRRGTHFDVASLNNILQRLKFEIEIHHDLEYCSVLDLLKKLNAADYTDCDCIIFFILTHGNKRREIAAKDVYYSVDKIWENFTADKCPTLAGKPKLFFMNACRGKKKDKGFRTRFTRVEADSSQKMQSYKIPNHADFLIVYSTVDEHLSYRETFNGTWFIQSFCTVLEEHYETKDLLKILTITAKRVALQYYYDEDDKCDYLQVPSITSMLLRDIYFNS